MQNKFNIKQKLKNLDMVEVCLEIIWKMRSEKQIFTKQGQRKEDP